MTFTGSLMGIGNPLLDITADPVTQELLDKYEVKLDSAILAEEKHIAIYDDIIKNFGPVGYCAGGATQNSIRVAQWMLGKGEDSGSTAFLGCVGDDAYGEQLAKSAGADGVLVDYMKDAGTPTGTCAVLVKDGERSLIANLAAANNFKASHLQNATAKEIIASAKFYYMAGFFLTVSLEAMEIVAKEAADKNKVFCVNMSAPFIIQFFGPKLATAIEYADYVFCNESEAATYADTNNLDKSDLKAVALAVAALPKKNSARPRTVIFTQGSESTIMAVNGVAKEYAVEILPKELLVDTNGAGDAFVGGFLSGLVKNKDMDTCINAGHWAARTIIQNSGCSFPEVCEHAHENKSEHKHEHEHEHKPEHQHEHKKQKSEHKHKHKHDHGHGHSHEQPEHKHEHKHDHGHGHSHDHGEDCDICDTLTTPDDVKDVEMPAWKKRAVETVSTSATAPFGGTWNSEASIAVTAAPVKLMDSTEQSHSHTHEHLDHPGHFSDRPSVPARDYATRPFTVGIGGPVGSGKTALMLALCRKLRESYSLGAVTNDIFTREDGEFLLRNGALEADRVKAVETGGCPHAAIREDISANLEACETLAANFLGGTRPIDLILLESGGDNLAANFSRELADLTLYVIDVAGGDKVPRKGGPGVTQSDVLIINKTDLAEAVGADLDLMDRDAKKMRGDGPTVFAQVRENLGKGVEDIVGHILTAWREATGKK